MVLTIVMLIIVLFGLGVLLKGWLDDRREDEWVEFTDHNYVGSTGTCIVWSLCGTEKCGLGPEDHRDYKEPEPEVVPMENSNECSYCQWPAKYKVFKGKSGGLINATCPEHLGLAVDRGNHKGRALVEVIR